MVPGASASISIDDIKQWDSPLKLAYSQSHFSIEQIKKLSPVKIRCLNPLLLNNIFIAANSFPVVQVAKEIVMIFLLQDNECLGYLSRINRSIPTKIPQNRVQATIPVPNSNSNSNLNLNPNRNPVNSILLAQEQARTQAAALAQSHQIQSQTQAQQVSIQQPQLIQIPHPHPHPHPHPQVQTQTQAQPQTQQVQVQFPPQIPK